MPRWLLATLAAATFLASWRWVVRPLRTAWDLVVSLLRRIGDASGGVATLTREVQAMAGAIVQLAAAIVDDQAQLREEHRWLAERHGELMELVVDLDAAVRRLERHTGLHGRGSPHEPD